jgi:predicted RNA-binding Zn ribbon-like protein
VDPATTPEANWALVGGRPCLDFVNTVGGRISSPRAGRTPAWANFADHITRDDIPDYDALLRWTEFASLVPASERRRLRNRARRAAPAAEQVRRRAFKLREAIYRIGKALLAGWPPPRPDLQTLDREVREARRHQQLVARGRRLETEWIPGTRGLGRVLWPVALSAASLFSSDDVNRLKQCGGTACGWLFLDTTRNHSRQWCDMADCGNLAKVRRFRRRQRRQRGH